MLTFEEAQRRVLAMAARLRPDGPQRERIPVRNASGRVLGEDVSAPVPLPRRDYSAMDGYAVSSRGFVGDGPWQLEVRGEARAGHSGPRVEPGLAVRIFTGASLPEGADSVIMQEQARCEGAHVTFARAPVEGQNIRRAGEDLQAGDQALPRGARLSGFQLGLLASVERSEVLVTRRPTVAIVCTGDELRTPGCPHEGGLAESNGISLAALVEAAGGEPWMLSAVADDLDSTTAALSEARLGADVIVTVGGVSVGDHDLVRPALAALGAEEDFWKVAIRPGKPLLLSRLGDSGVLGLPGNPSSAQITFALFGFPLLRALQGDAKPVPLLRSAKLAEPFRQKPGRRGFYRAHLAGDEVSILANQASGASTAMAWANSLAVVAENVETVEAGQSLAVLAYADL